MADRYNFTCPNGHSFNAVAKLRARCPECGAGTRRNFSVIPTKPIGQEKPSQSSSNTTVKVVDKKTSDRGSKPVSTSKTDKPLESETKSSDVSAQSSKKSPRVIRQGMMPKQKPKITPPPATKTIAPVSRRRAKVGSHPTVSRQPTGSRERKTVKKLAEIEDIPFWQKVKRKYFR